MKNFNQKTLMKAYGKYFHSSPFLLFLSTLSLTFGSKPPKDTPVFTVAINPRCKDRYSKENQLAKLWNSYPEPVSGTNSQLIGKE